MPIRADRDRPVQWFFENVLRPEFDEAMQLGGDDRFYRLHDALHDAAYRNTSKATLCRKLGISLLDLFDLWTRYNHHSGMMRMANHLPEVMEQLAEDALSHQEVCSRCDGIGAAADRDIKRACAVCDGAGSVRVCGDGDTRQLLLEIARLINGSRQYVMSVSVTLPN